MTEPELTEIELRWKQEQEYFLGSHTADPVVPALTAALREAWADSHTLTEALKLGSEQYRVSRARIAELEGQLEFAEDCLRWKSARIAELEAVAERRKEIDMSQQCGAKQEGNR